jgi:hypothetical protein
MTVSARSIAFFADFRSLRALRWIVVVAVLAAIAAPATADARARIVRAGAYDGVWNVAFATTAGNCSSTNSVPFMVSGNRVSSAGRRRQGHRGHRPPRQRFRQNIRRRIQGER